jgi:hypothetical protein
MSKKIKITEDQLKRLMVLKEENEGELEELVTIPSYMALAQGDASKVIMTIKEKYPQMFDGSDDTILADYLNNFIDTLKGELLGGESNGEDEMSTNDEPTDGYANEMQPEDDTVNESVQKIKTTFRRFL